MQRRFEMQRQLNINPLCLEDFNSKNIKIKKVPKNASQTCMGQKLIKPIIEPIIFTDQDNHLMKMSKETIEKFALTE